MSIPKHIKEHKVVLGNLTQISAPFVALGTQTDGSGVPTGVLVDEAGNPLTTLSATIVPRTGTLASLLTFAGEVGEIASATDANALVKFNGTSGQAKAYYRNAEKYRVVGNGKIVTANKVAAGVEVIFDLTSVIYDPDGLADLTNNCINIPSETDLLFRVEIASQEPYDATVAGTYRKIEPQTYPYGFWLGLPTATKVQPFAVTGLPFSVNLLALNLANGTPMVKMQFAFKHDASVSVPTSAQNEISMQFFVSMYKL